MLKSIWNKMKDWSGWSAAGSIFWARLEVFAGFVLAVLGSVDWSPLLNMDLTQAFSWNQFTLLGLIMISKAVIAEMIRRHNATDLH